MHRREWIKLTGLGMVGGSLDLVSQEAMSLPTVVIDSHTHFYDPHREGGVPWPKPGSPLYRTVMPEDWRQVANPCGVTKTVVVEASPWLEDNQWILDLAMKDSGKSIIGFVGNLDPMDPDFHQHLERFAANGLFRGIRVSGKKFTDYSREPSFIDGMQQLSKLGLSLDVNGGAPMLERLVELLGRVPELKVIIDHVGSAGDPANISKEWKHGMKQAAEAGSQVYCKVSGLPEQSKFDGWGSAQTEVEKYRPILDWIWNGFGEDRLIFGSNWPVSDRGASYEKVFRLGYRYVAAKGQPALRKFYESNVVNAYGLTLK